VATEGNGVGLGGSGLTKKGCMDACDGVASCNSASFKQRNGECWLKDKQIAADASIRKDCWLTLFKTCEAKKKLADKEKSTKEKVKKDATIKEQAKEEAATKAKEKDAKAEWKKLCKDDNAALAKASNRYATDCRQLNEYECLQGKYREHCCATCNRCEDDIAGLKKATNSFATDCRKLNKCSHQIYLKYCCASCTQRKSSGYNKPPCARDQEEVVGALGSICTPRCLASSTCPKVQFGEGSDSVRFATLAKCNFKNPRSSDTLCVIRCNPHADYSAGQCPEGSLCEDMHDSVPGSVQGGICVYPECNPMKQCTSSACCAKHYTSTSCARCVKYQKAGYQACGPYTPIPEEMCRAGTICSDIHARTWCCKNGPLESSIQPDKCSTLKCKEPQHRCPVPTGLRYNGRWKN